MAKPKPPVELRKMRTSVSLPLAMVIASDNLRQQKPDLHLRDFSDAVKRGLYEFLEKHSPGIVQRTADHIRLNYSATVAPPAPEALKVAEDPGTYGEMTVDEQASAKAKRLQQGRGAAPKAPASGGKSRQAPPPASARKRAGTP